MCSIAHESIDQFMGPCMYAQTVWNSISTHIGVDLVFHGGFGPGNWLINNTYSLYIKSIIAAASWFFWKARCEFFFSKYHCELRSIVCSTLACVADFYNASWPLIGRRLIHNNFSTTDGPFLFISNSWSDAGLISGAGFSLLALTIIFCWQDRVP